MSEFWLISAPGEKTCKETWDRLNKATSANTGVSTNYKFHIPELKVGTLDTLVGLSDDLVKVDQFCESVTRKVAHYLSDVLEEQKDKLQENLLANGLELGNYLTHFQWDMAKFPIRQNLRSISDIVTKQVSQIDNDLKSRAAVYNNLKGTLQSLERRATGSLLTRSLVDLIKKEDFVQESDYLTTLLVVVAKPNYRDWYGRYEKLSDMVVPRSTKLVYEDGEHGLFTVSLFTKVVDEYKMHCRENKFVVRDFVYNEEELSAGKNELTKLASDKKKQFGPLVRWLKVNFSEAFTAWIHIKSLRAFVESVLRYGLPVNFQAMLLEPGKKQKKRLKEVLYGLYSHLDSANTKDSASDMIDIPGLNMGGGHEYFPYIYYKINIDMSG